MSIRYYDVIGKYAGAVLKEYEYWILEVSWMQHTLGSFIIFSRHDVGRISGLRDKALLELPRVMREIEGVLTESPDFRADRFNYFQMGNKLDWLHFHGIPRYKTPRTFMGREWVDATWGMPPVWSEEEISLTQVEHLRKAISHHLANPSPRGYLR